MKFYSYSFGFDIFIVECRVTV